MTDATPVPAIAEEIAAPPAPATPLTKAAFYVGAGGLMVATTADAIAVVGRHAGFPLLGSIEIVQAAIVFIAASSMVSVTLARGHAAVHILTDRLSPDRRATFARVSQVLGAIAILFLAAGSFILLADLWNGHERSELLHIPLRVFRLLMIAALLCVSGLFLRHAFVRKNHGA